MITEKGTLKMIPKQYKYFSDYKLGQLVWIIWEQNRISPAIIKSIEFTITRRGSKIRYLAYSGHERRHFDSSNRDHKFFRSQESAIYSVF